MHILFLVHKLLQGYDFITGLKFIGLPSACIYAVVHKLIECNHFDMELHRFKI